MAARQDAGHARVEGSDAPVAIEIRGVSKCYHIYSNPSDRLRQALLRWKRRYYREFWALRDISLTLRRGETLGLIGRNGSGKSTLLQIICGTMAPSSGTVSVHGKISALLELGAGFNKEFTGRENVYLAGAIRGLSRAQVNRVFDQITAFADIGDFIDQPVKTYSSGMYVRLAFAVASQVKPDILVVDEALAVGDVFFQQKCARYMREQLGDTTKILVTHDMHSVAKYCTRVVVLDRGEISYIGSPLDAVSHYLRIVHDDAFRGAKGTYEFKGAGTARDSYDSVESLPWVDVSTDTLGGAKDVIVERACVTTPDGERAGVLQPGDAFSCYSIVRADRPIDSLIFGVGVHDRFGVMLFGDNTCSIPDGLYSLSEPGRYLVRLDYKWPAVQPGEYTVTFGVGQGTDAIAHVIQCWAHHAVSVRGISPSRPIHGVFTNPMIGAKVSRLANP